MPTEDKELRKVGLKVTLPRIKVLQVLESADPHHLTAENVYRALVDAGEEVGLATVYRVLTQFESAGLVERHNFDSGQAVFELARGEHHDHIVCVDCGCVMEFTDEVIEAQQEKIAARMGFRLEDHSLYLYGRCKKTNCPNRENS
ncbi:MAG: ferric iron uptake transcriptional regulator [Gammaproteobacteria bacterium]